MVEAQTWMDTHPKTITKIRINPIPGTPMPPGEVENPGGGVNRLTGSLKIENYPDLTEVILSNNEITELTITNCPNLERINFNNNNKVLAKVNLEKIVTKPSTIPGVTEADDNKVRWLNLGGNNIEELNLEKFKELQEFFIHGNEKLDLIKGIDKLPNIVVVNSTGSKGIIKFFARGKADYLKEVVKVAKELLGIDPSANLPLDANGKLDVSKLKSELKDKVVNNDSRLGAVQEEARVAKESNKQLEDQITEIVGKLGLGEDANKHDILSKIEELMNRPTVSQKNSEIVQKDSEISDLRQQLAAEKQKVADLQNKPTDGNLEDVVAKMRSGFENSGIVVSPTREEKIKSTSSAMEVMKVGNNIYNEELTKEKEGKKSAIYLNAALGILLVVASSALVWLIVEKNKLPTEDKK